MIEKYYTLLTKVGVAKLTNATLMGDTLKLTTIKVGDGGTDEGAETSPSESSTDLVRPQWSGSITSLSIDPENKGWVVIEAVIPVDQGDFYITEFGIYDEEKDLICIGKYPKTYKPKVQQNSGSASSLHLKVILAVSNAKNIELKIDPATVLASREYVDNKYIPKTGGTFEGNIHSKGEISGKGLKFDNHALIASEDNNQANCDHIWHDDNNDGVNSGYHGAWHFCSDAPNRKTLGNSRVQAGGYSLTHGGKTVHLKAGDKFSGYSGSSLTVATPFGKSSIGMANDKYCHFSTEANQFHFEKPVTIRGEILTGDNYKSRVYHEGFKPTKEDIGLSELPNEITDAVNDASSNKLATAKAVNSVNESLSKHISAADSHTQYLLKQDRDIFGDPAVEGAVRKAIFHGKIYSTGGIYNYQHATGGFADFVPDLGTSSNVYVHFRTPFNTNDHNEMFWFHIYGYSYGNVGIIDEKIVGYCYADENRFVNPNASGNFSPTTYVDSNGNIVMRLFFTEVYHVTMCIDTMRNGNYLLPNGCLEPKLSLSEEVTFS